MVDYTRLNPPEHWEFTSIIKEEVIGEMAVRAEVELQEITAGKEIAATHGETVRNYAGIEQLLTGAMRFTNRIGFPAKGVAADLGSGTGVAACILSQQEQIEKIYAIEYSEHFVASLMPLVFKQFGARVEKIQRVIPFLPV